MVFGMSDRGQDHWLFPTLSFSLIAHLAAMIAHCARAHPFISGGDITISPSRLGAAETSIGKFSQEL